MEENIVKRMVKPAAGYILSVLVCKAFHLSEE